MMMQMSSVVGIGSANFSSHSLSPSFVSTSTKFSSQSRFLGFSISQDYHSSLCCKLNVGKLNIWSVPTPGPHGKSTRFTAFLVKATTTDHDDNVNNDIIKWPSCNAERVMCDISQHHPKMYQAAFFHFLKKMADNTQGQTQWSSLRWLVDQVEKVNGETSREELMYRFVVELLAENDIAMVPDLNHIMKPSSSTLRIDLFWVNWFKAMHSREAFEMMLNFAHERGHQFATTTMADDPTTKMIKLRDLYVDSVVYGYYLCDLEERYRQSCGKNEFPFHDEIDMTNLKSYLTSMVWTTASSSEEDVMLLRRIGGTRILEGAISTIEKRTKEIFGNLIYNIHTNVTGIEKDNDHDMKMTPMTITGIYILLLEAVTFGLFLLQAKRYVDELEEFTIPSPRK